MKINILGTEYEITFEEFGDKDTDGYCDYTSKRIVMRSDNYNQIDNFDHLKQKQLRHEIIHAFMAESGLQANWEHAARFGHDETTVDFFAIQFPKMAKAFIEAGCLDVEPIKEVFHIDTKEFTTIADKVFKTK